MHRPGTAAPPRTTAPAAPAGPLGRVRGTFRARVAGDPTGAPGWVREIAVVGGREGWFDPSGVVWAVHGGLTTLVGGLVALLGQAAHPLALAGVQGHSNYREDPWARLAGTARWLAVCTFGSAELAERDCARVRGMHRRVRGTTADGRAYSAGDPQLLRWVHLAFTDAFLAAHRELGADLAPRFGPRWADAYVRDWARTARALGAGDLPGSEAELAEALAGFAPVLEPVPADLRRFLLAPPGLSRPEVPFYAGLSGAADLLLSPVVAPLAGAPGRSARGPRQRLRLAATRAQLRALRAVTGREPWEQAGRFRTGTGPRPDWL
ncbi:oxygenase MpaB family protein [Kineococcus sp. SYSU DK005]|uniref:oxygenase MpaB family protein n=1 Tax=Kineococcus sp. SYSU DK005 TaxID=3383126 RepID=UPI003D7E105E